MDFWATSGQNIEKSKTIELLKSGCSLCELLREPLTIEDFYG